MPELRKRAAAAGATEDEIIRVSQREINATKMHTHGTLRSEGDDPEIRDSMALIRKVLMLSFISHG
jgi:hypothetical protein